MEISYPLCDFSYQGAPWRLKRHAEVHRMDPPLLFRCELGGCKEAEASMQEPLAILEHHLQHLRFRQEENLQGKEESEHSDDEVEEEEAPYDPEAQ